MCPANQGFRLFNSPDNFILQKQAIYHPMYASNWGVTAHKLEFEACSSADGVRTEDGLLLNQLLLRTQARSMFKFPTLHSQWFEPSGQSLTPSQPSWERVNYRRCQQDEASKVCSEAHTEVLLRKKKEEKVCSLQRFARVIWQIIYNYTTNSSRQEYFIVLKTIPAKTTLHSGFGPEGWTHTPSAQKALTHSCLQTSSQMIWESWSIS